MLKSIIIMKKCKQLAAEECYSACVFSMGNMAVLGLILRQPEFDSAISQLRKIFKRSTKLENETLLHQPILVRRRLNYYNEKSNAC